MPLDPAHDPLHGPTVQASAEQQAALGARRLRRVAPAVAERLAQRIVGQDEALQSVARAVRRAASGLPRRGPLASLLFVGPTGTGKTELARALAEVLGTPFRLLRVDASELSAAHEVSRLVGAPPGYVGHEAGGSLTEGILRHPQAVLLVDEVEKAHPSVHRLLLQLLDEARLTDGKGRSADFSRAFVLLTSNCGTRELAAAREGLGFARATPGRRPEHRGEHRGEHGDTAGRLSPAAQDEILRRALAARFAPEFLGRLDAVVPFRDLAARDVERIAAARLARLARDVRRRRARLSWTPAVARWIAHRAEPQKSGARSIEALVARHVEPLVVDALLDGEAARGWLTLSIRGDRPRLRHEPR